MIALGGSAALAKGSAPAQGSHRACSQCAMGRSSSRGRCEKWTIDQGIETALINPGKPWQNGVGESLNGKFRDECLSLEWFLSRAQAKVVIEAWRRHYNEVRPHSSLGYLTPAEFAAKLEQTNAAPASATGRDAARHRGFAPRPVATPSSKGNRRSRRRRFSQVNRGPTNQGRSPPSVCVS